MWCSAGVLSPWGGEVCPEATGEHGSQGLEGREGVFPVGLPDKIQEDKIQDPSSM